MPSNSCADKGCPPKGICPLSKRLYRSLLSALPTMTATPEVRNERSGKSHRTRPTGLGGQWPSRVLQPSVPEGCRVPASRRLTACRQAERGRDKKRLTIFVHYCKIDQLLIDYVSGGRQI